MPRHLRKRAALALRLAMRTNDNANRDRLIAVAAESLEAAAEQERTEEIPAHAVAAQVTIKSTRN